MILQTHAKENIVECVKGFYQSILFANHYQNMGWSETDNKETLYKMTAKNIEEIASNYSGTTLLEEGNKMKEEKRTGKLRLRVMPC